MGIPVTLCSTEVRCGLCRRDCPECKVPNVVIAPHVDGCSKFGRILPCPNDGVRIVLLANPSAPSDLGTEALSVCEAHYMAVAS